MLHSASTALDAAAPADDHPYVRFEDMHAQSPLLRWAAKVVDGLSASWLWVAIGVSALWWLVA